ncbi:HpcH/HpaI aldolase/citrate lyase family protein [Nesterenkonia xinjiangensis]|uniref:Citrate lyase subunit beta/citryl-CoA lyase n=1 Tax=Nesterenkonia xinjiangensis TaxID=225327 RepID=A0A7Z0GKP9_9MICC|nr:CoA ester lyase [Nesterenkonia xinjiangensis]NYJ77801.1 citrate lyase subunit beta/citryl-CoA lyase [Nesterenkonia xinjiangensis]
MPRTATAQPPFPLGPALLFCPGSRPDRFGKAADRADAVIVDLEDAVTPAEKAAARAAVVAALTGGTDAVPALDPALTMVRINSRAPQDRDADLAALVETPVRHVVAPKADDVDLLDRIAATLPEVGIIPQIEGPVGVLNALRIASHPAVEALFWGPEDMIAGLGGTTSRKPDGTYREVIRHIRHSVLVAAGAAGVPAVDAIHTDFRDTKRVAVEAEDACASGFIAKACIHPNQVEPVRRAYTPAAEAVEWAKALLAVFRHQAGAHDDGTPVTEPHAVGAFTFRGEMVDAAVVLQARRIMSRYDATRVRQPGE